MSESRRRNGIEKKKLGRVEVGGEEVVRQDRKVPGW